VTMKILKAKPGFIVRDPETGQELTGELKVEMTPFWWRRLDRKEVEEVVELKPIKTQKEVNKS
jgi:hypothetical protein